MICTPAYIQYGLGVKMKIDQKIQDTEDIGHYDGEWYMVRERRLVTLEAVANTARVYMSALRDIPEHGLSDKALELLAALDALDKGDK